MKRLMKFAAFAAGAAFPGAMASATSVTLDTVTLVGSDYEYSYSATLGGDEGLVPGSKFVIFDFGDYVPGSVDSGIYSLNLIASTELTTMGVLLALGAIDDPLIPNLVFTWTGASFNAVGGPFSDVSFSGLNAKSKNSTVTLGSFSVLSTTNNGFATGTPFSSQAFVGVPAQLATAVPAPATWAMMLLGFGGIGFALRRRREGFQQGAPA